jgi:hypothetical protein
VTAISSLSRSELRQRRSFGFRAFRGARLTALLALALSSSALGATTSLGGGGQPAQPAQTYSYMITKADSPVQWLWGGPTGQLPGEGVTIAQNRAINFAATLNTFPGPTVDALMQQCYGGGFAPNFQAAISNYTFTAATTWNETANVTTTKGFALSWNQSLPRSNEGMLMHYNDATNGAAAVVGPPAYGAVTADPFGPSGASRMGNFYEDPIFTSPDNAPGGANNIRNLYTTPGPNNVYALLIAPNPTGVDGVIQPGITALYNTLLNTVKVPANQICVLYGNNAANTFVSGIPVNGPANVANITAASTVTGGLFGDINAYASNAKQTAPPAPTLANKSDLFMYSTGHGNSLTVNGAVGKATIAVNPGPSGSVKPQVVGSGSGSLGITVNVMPANNFTYASGADTDDGSTVDLQLTSSAPPGDLSGLPISLDGQSLGLLNFESTPDTDLSPALGNTYYYDVQVSVDMMNAILDSPSDQAIYPNPFIEVDSISSSDLLTYGDYLASSVTFDEDGGPLGSGQTGDSWTDTIVPEPATLGLIALASLTLLKRRNRPVPQI